jgi:hypothetical protein
VTSMIVIEFRLVSMEKSLCSFVLMMPKSLCSFVLMMPIKI